MAQQTCGNTFDGQHHYAPRRWATGSEIACVCGMKVPAALRAEVEAALAETAAERERQRVLSVHPSDKKTGVEARNLMRQLL